MNAIDSAEVSEGQGYVELCVAILNGSLARDTQFDISLASGSAVGEN